jgi:antitoxin HicB
MNTSRTQVERLLDPENDSGQLDTIQKAASILGKRLIVTFEDIPLSAA